MQYKCAHYSRKWHKVIIFSLQMWITLLISRINKKIQFEYISSSVHFHFLFILGRSKPWCCGYEALRPFPVLWGQSRQSESFGSFKLSTSFYAQLGILLFNLRKIWIEHSGQNGQVVSQSVYDCGFDSNKVKLATTNDLSCYLSVIPGKRKRNIRCFHIERKDLGRTSYINPWLVSV